MAVKEQQNGAGQDVFDADTFARIVARFDSEEGQAAVHKAARMAKRAGMRFADAIEKPEYKTAIWRLLRVEALNPDRKQAGKTEDTETLRKELAAQKALVRELEITIITNTEAQNRTRAASREQIEKLEIEVAAWKKAEACLQAARAAERLKKNRAAFYVAAMNRAAICATAMNRAAICATAMTLICWVWMVFGVHLLKMVPSPAPTPPTAPVSFKSIPPTPAGKTGQLVALPDAEPPRKVAVPEQTPPKDEVGSQPETTPPAPVEDFYREYGDHPIPAVICRTIKVYAYPPSESEHQFGGDEHFWSLERRQWVAIVSRHDPDPFTVKVLNTTEEDSKIEFKGTYKTLSGWVKSSQLSATCPP